MPTTQIETLPSPLNTLTPYKYTVIFARYQNKWLYPRHRDRDTFETAGGHIEAGETPLEAAKRELYEETGAIKFDIEPTFDYSVRTPTSYANGQVFLAHIHTLGDMPNFEMVEVRLFDIMPDKMRFPEILPVLFGYLQGWMNRQTAKDEILDVYDSNRRLTGRTHRRVDTLPFGDYRLVVLVWLMNSRGEFLITRRASNKGFPNMWECTGGSVLAGDDSLTSAIREVKEETGLSINPKNGECLFTQKRSDTFFDVWLFRQDFDVNDVVLQEGETTAAKYATMDEIRELVQKKAFVPCGYLDELFLKAGQDA